MIDCWAIELYWYRDRFGACAKNRLRGSAVRCGDGEVVNIVSSNLLEPSFAIFLLELLSELLCSPSAGFMMQGRVTPSQSQEWLPSSKNEAWYCHVDVTVIISSCLAMKLGQGNEVWLFLFAIPQLRLDFCLE
jgi:hypothetical protein